MKKRRSFKPSEITELDFPIIASNRIGPGVLKFPENKEKMTLFADRERDNFLWTLLRFHSIPNQIVPSWTGFNITIQNDIPVMKSTIKYLDCIDAPATDSSTIYQVSYFIQKMIYLAILCYNLNFISSLVRSFKDKKKYIDT